MKGTMYKLSCGKKYDIHELDNILSDNHAITEAKNIKEKAGLIGRYYIELSNGNNYQI